MKSNIFVLLPRPMALLLLASVLRLTEAHALPRQTLTVPLRMLNVAPYPPLPTPAPISPLELRDLLLRQNTNTICGYIGGDAKLPATCSAGSHCVVDNDHNVVGCCPNGQETCSTGVFTGCVDFNSGPQTEANPYVFTCQGSDVCYKNIFGGGHSQFGCGTASDLATSVAASATGITQGLALTSASVDFSRTATSLATPTSIDPKTGTRSFTRATTSPSSTSTATKTSSSSSSSPSSSSSTSSSSSSVSRSPTASATLQTPVPSSGSGVDRTGAIVGGTISGVAVLIALVAVGIYCWRRRRRNVREGPGPTPQGPTQYISPMSGGPQGFAPLHQSNEHYETGLHPNYGYSGPAMAGVAAGARPLGDPMYDQQQYYQQYGPLEGYHYQAQHPAAYPGGGAVVGGVAGPNMEADQVPLTREIDDFSHGYSRALDRIGEEDESPYESGSSGANSGNAAQSHNAATAAATGDDGDLGTQSTGGTRPLWHQNRRQSRNMMWM